MEKIRSHEDTKTPRRNISEICALCSLWLIFSCTPAVYLKDHKPTDLIFQKKVYGGIAALTGTELNAPVFSLYADGTVIYARYEEGKRKWVTSRFARGDFYKLYQRIQSLLPKPADSLLETERSKNTAMAVAPTTEFLFESKVMKIDGLGSYVSTPAVVPLQEFSKDLDTYAFKEARPVVFERIVLYVKRVEGGDPTAWPAWAIQKIDPGLLYNKEVNFYEPNVPENSVVLDGETAGEVQRMIEQAGIYQKISFRGKIYALGYRPVLPQ